MKLRPEFRLSERANLVISAAIAAVVAVLIAVTFRDLPGARKDFYDNIWAPANLLLHGRNPYLPASIKTGLPTLWLPMALGLFLPLGLLEPETAARVWFILSVLEAAIIVLLAQSRERRPVVTAIGMVALFFFPGTIHHFVLGQFSLTAAICLMLAARCARRGQDWRAAFLLALATTKPQLVSLGLMGVLFFYWSKSGLRRAGLFGGRYVIAGIILTVPMLASPSPWIPAWWENMRNNPSWLHPSLFSVLTSSLGGWGLAIWAYAAAAGILACIAAWRSLVPEAAMAWTLVITTVVAPYLWSWDFVLVLPLWISIFGRVNWQTKLLLILVYAGGWSTWLIAQLREKPINQAFWWVPLWFTLALVAVSMRELREGVAAGGEAIRT